MSFIEKYNGYYDDMLKLRISLGYSIGNDAQKIRGFIEFCDSYCPDSTSITKEMVDSWMGSKVFKTNATQNHMLAKLRLFTRYLASIGVPCFIPSEDYYVRRVRYVPYLFTDSELAQLFEAIDGFPPNNGSSNREYIVPVMFRMMYCCGMRPSEPPSLLVEDVDLETGEICIRQSKGSKDRRILMSDDLSVLCRNYAVLMSPQKYFFERSPGIRICSNWIWRQFHYCWERSGLPKRGNPRPADLRHNFATRTMMRWVDEGKDVFALAPYLSAYMGHASLSATLYYVHLIPERLKKSSGIDWARFAGIYPEVSDEQD